MALERVGWRDRGVVEFLYLCLVETLLGRG